MKLSDVQNTIEETRLINIRLKKSYDKFCKENKINMTLLLHKTIEELMKKK